MDTELQKNTVTIRNVPIFYLDHWLHDTNRPHAAKPQPDGQPQLSFGLQLASWPALPCIILGQQNTQGLNWAWQLTTDIHSSTPGKGSGVIGLSAVDLEMMTSHGIFQPPSQTSRTSCHSEKWKLTQLGPARESQREHTLIRQYFDSNNISKQANVCQPAATVCRLLVGCMTWRQPTSNLRTRDQDQASQHQEPESFVRSVRRFWMTQLTLSTQNCILLHQQFAFDANN